MWPSPYFFQFVLLTSLSARSRHPRGVQLFLADAIVRFLRDSITHSLYRALSTKNGGEPVTAP